MGELRLQLRKLRECQKAVLLEHACTKLVRIGATGPEAKPIQDQVDRLKKLQVQFGELQKEAFSMQAGVEVPAPQPPREGKDGETILLQVTVPRPKWAIGFENNTKLHISLQDFKHMHQTLMD